MHIHGSIPNVEGAAFYGVSNGERAAEGRRAAEIRRRLMKAGASAEAEATPEETGLVNQWMDERRSQVPAQVPAGEGERGGRDPDFG